VQCHINAISLAANEPYCSASPAQVPEMINGLRRIAMISTRNEAER
jgi:hypothetical protein